MENNYILPILILIPVLGAVAIAAFGPRQPQKVGQWSMGFSLIALLATIDLPFRLMEKSNESE